MSVIPPEWQELGAATAQKPDAVWVDLDRPRDFMFGFGIPAPPRKKPKKRKKKKT